MKYGRSRKNSASTVFFVIDYSVSFFSICRASAPTGFCFSVGFVWICRAARALREAPLRGCASPLDLQIVGDDAFIVPRANTVCPYRIVICRWVCMKFYLVRADEVTATPLPFCRFATFPLIGESSSAPTGCVSSLDWGKSNDARALREAPLRGCASPLSCTKSNRARAGVETCPYKM